MDRKPLTIVELTARNVLNLRAVRITPDKKVVVLTGKNGAGKSNVLDIIQALLEGLKFLKSSPTGINDHSRPLKHSSTSSPGRWLTR
jgi:recombinational DNA repair ATPase RecF